MLNRFDRHLIARQTGRELDARQVMNRRRHLVVAEIGSAKTDAEVLRRWPEGKSDAIAGVKTYSVAGDRATKCALYVHQPLEWAVEEPRPGSAKRMPEKGEFVWSR